MIYMKISVKFNLSLSQYEKIVKSKSRFKNRKLAYTGLNLT